MDRPTDSRRAWAHRHSLAADNCRGRPGRACHCYTIANRVSSVLRRPEFTDSDRLFALRHWRLHPRQESGRPDALAR